MKKNSIGIDEGKKCLSCLKSLPTSLKTDFLEIYSSVICNWCQKKNSFVKCPCKKYIQTLADNYYGKKHKCLICNNVFQLVPCIACKKPNLYQGNYSYGTICNCCHCKTAFQQVPCGFCKESNFWNVSQGQYYRIGHEIKCISCKKISQQTNCPNCKEANVFKNCGYIMGIKQKCDYCKLNYQHLNCPFCQKALFFDSLEFSYGQPLTCNGCNSYFSVGFCNKCANYNFEKKINSIKGNDEMSCNNCNNKYRILSCPNCKIANYPEDLKKGKCDSFNCGSCHKDYALLFCSNCGTLSNCNCEGNNFVHKCRICNFNCGVKKNSMVVKNVPNLKNDSPVHSNNLNEAVPDDKLCKVCLDREVGSIFTGCGHACLCLSCAKDIKGCPMCRKKSECIKIYF